MTQHGAHVTRHYRWWTAFGVRGSMADGLTRALGGDPDAAA